MDPVLCSKGLQEAMIVAIFKTGLKYVVVHIDGGMFHLDPRNPHRFELQACHRARRVLHQYSVDAETYFLPLLHAAIFEV